MANQDDSLSDRDVVADDASTTDDATVSDNTVGADGGMGADNHFLLDDNTLAEGDVLFDVSSAVHGHGDICTVRVEVIDFGAFRGNGQNDHLLFVDTEYTYYIKKILKCQYL